MKTKTLQEQYNLIQEGQGNQEIFTKQAKKQFPNFIPNSAPFTQVADILKDRGVIAENIMGVGVVTSKPTNPDWFKIFNQNINEEGGIKINRSKPSDQVTDLEEKNYDYNEEENIDNNYGESFLNGFYYEMKQKSNEDKSIDEIKKVVNKNLNSNRLYYVENGQFGVDGVGYTKDYPGLGEPKEPKGEWKSSGYGNLEENKTTVDSTKLIEKYLTEDKSKRFMGKSMVNEATDYTYKTDSGGGKPTLVLNLGPESWQKVKHLFDGDGKPTQELTRIPASRSVWDLHAQKKPIKNKDVYKIYGVSGDYTFGNAPTFYQQKYRGNKRAAKKVFDWFIKKYLTEDKPTTN